jgi:hypothetical protein
VGKAINIYTIAVRKSWGKKNLGSHKHREDDNIKIVLECTKVWEYETYSSSSG